MLSEISQTQKEYMTSLACQLPKNVKHMGAESSPVLAKAQGWEMRVIGDAGRWAQTVNCEMNEFRGI